MSKNPEVNILKKLVIICTMVFATVSAFAIYDSFSVQAKLKEGFVVENSNTYYYQNGVKKTGLVQVGKSKYYFDKKTGIMKKGYNVIDGKKYLFDEKTGKMLTGIRVVNKGTVNETKYKFMPEGDVFKKGLYKEPTSGSYYYFNKTTGAAHKGNLVDEYGRRFVFDSKTGVMLTGMRSLNGNTYYYLETGGVYKGGIKIVNGSKYYFDKKTGIMKKGYNVIDGKKYLFDEKTGKMLTGIRVVNKGTVNETKYKFMPEGDVFKKGLYKEPTSGSYYYFNKTTGAAHKGNLVDEYGRRFVFDSKTGVMLTGMRSLNGNTYYYLETGGVYKGGIKTVNGSKYYFDKKTGIMKKGYNVIDGKKYLFDEKTGKMLTGLHRVNVGTTNETIYYFLQSGDVYRGGVINANGKRYYFDETTGAARKGYIKTSNNKHYYADKETALLANGIIRINDNTVYYFTAGGTLKKGLISENGNQYYFDPQSGNMRTGMCTLEINGINKKFWFDRTTGKAKTGVQYVDTLSRNYYFDVNEASGVRTGLQEYNNNTYFFDEYGIGHTKFQSYDRNLYYFDEETYAMKKNYDFTIEDYAGSSSELAQISFHAGSDGKITFKSTGTLNIRSQIIYNGLEKLGEPYAYVDVDPGYNCSSFVYHNYQGAGLNVFGTGTNDSRNWKTYSMSPYVYDNYKTFTDFNELKPGDLIFWSKEDCGDVKVDENGNCIHRWTRDGKEYHIHHVGMYIGNGQVIESYEPYDAVVIQDLKIITSEQNSNYYFSFYANIIDNM